MSVAWVVSANATTGSSTSPWTISITVSGTNPVLFVGVGLASDTAAVTAVTWSLGSDTPYEVGTIRVGTAYASVWAIPAPGAGAGTITVTNSGAAVHQGAASVFQGAAQTSAVSSADDIHTDSKTTGTGGADVTLTVTPLNLTADDCSFGLSVNTVAGDENGFTTNDRYKNSSTATNLAIGDSSGTTALVAGLRDSVSFNWVAIGVRVVAFGAAGDLSLSANDTVTISDTPSLAFDFLAPSVSDTVTITDTPNAVLNPSTVGFGALLANYRNRRVIS